MTVHWRTILKQAPIFTNNEHDFLLKHLQQQCHRSLQKRLVENNIEEEGEDELGFILQNRQSFPSYAVGYVYRYRD